MMALCLLRVQLWACKDWVAMAKEFNCALVIIIHANPHILVVENIWRM